MESIGSKSELAKLLGVSAAMVSKHIRNGVVQVREDGRVDLNQAVKSVQARKDPARGGKGGAPNREVAPAEPETADLDLPGDSFNSNRANREKWQAKLTRLEYEREVGLLIELAAYAKGCEDAGLALGKELDGMVFRLAAAVAGETSLTKCRELIAAEVFRARDTAASTLEALAADPRAGTKQ